MRFALVGYGTGGRWFHSPLIATAPECALVGVVTRSPERRALVAEDHPAVRTFDTMADAAEAGVEAVAISTPADTHSTLTDQALKLGLHAVCDKPFALDAKAAAKSVKRAAKRGLLLSPYQNRRWDSDFLTVRQLVDTGRLGRVTTFESRFERNAPDRGPRPAGGGTLLDFFSHLVDQALVLLGPVDTVEAWWRIRDNGLDDDVMVDLVHTGGARSQLFGSWSQDQPGPRFTVTGSEGTYVVDGPMDGQEDLLRRGDTPGTLGDRWGVEPQSRWGTLRRGDQEEVVPTRPGAWPSFYRAFAAAVRGEGDVPVAATDAVETARVLDAARTSARSAEVVTLAH